jgi:putative intracellular protease/amidase
MSRYNLLFVLIIFSVLFSNNLLQSSPNSSYVLSEINNEIETLEDIDILTILDDGYGLTYFQAKEFFKSLKCNFWTTGETNNILSCPSAPNTTRFSEPVNLTIDEVDVTDYDCIFIPSGPHWKTLIYSEEILKFLVQAREQGIILSSLCIGTYVLAAAEVLQGVKVLGHDLAAYLIQQGGGIYCTNEGYRVISHNGIITGSVGNRQNPEGGYLDAPTIELCKTIVKELLGESFFVQANFEANNIEVETQDLSNFNESS